MQVQEAVKVIQSQMAIMACSDYQVYVGFSVGSEDSPDIRVLELGDLTRDDADSMIRKSITSLLGDRTRPEQPATS